MRAILCACLAVLFLHPAGALSQQASQEPDEKLQQDGSAPPPAQATATEKGGETPSFYLGLEDGTPVRLGLSRGLSSKKDKVGDRVELEVVEDVKVRDVVVIPKGALARGTISEVHSKSSFGRAGKLALRIDELRLADGETVQLRAIHESLGTDRKGVVTAGIVASVLFFYPGIPGALVIPGSDISVPKGAEVVAYVNGDTPLDPPKFASPSPFSAVPSAALAPLAPSGMEASACARDRFSVSVNVITRDGQIVQGLESPSFQASTHRKQLKILSARWGEQPRRVVIVMDASARVIGKKQIWDAALYGADELAAQMPAVTQVGLAAFSDTIEREVLFDADRHRLLNALSELRRSPKPFVKGGNRTALWNALGDSLSLFGPLRGGDVLYVISDGKDDASLTKPEEVEKALLGTGIRVFLFRLVYGETWRRAKEVGAPGPLQELVDSTGGTSVIQAWDEAPYITESDNGQGDRTEESRRLAANLMQQFRLMARYYRLQVEPPEAIDTPQEWELRITNPKALKDASVVYPHVLAPCSVARPDVTKPQ